MRTFASRIDAARQLANALSRYRGSNPLVLAIPRGAVPMARVIADELGGELDVVLVRKLRAPSNPELAVGAIDERGWTYLASHAAQAGADDDYLRREQAFQLRTMQARRACYTPDRPPIDPEGRIVIVVDDGIATGATMIAALHATRSKHPARLVCAVPVAPPDGLARIRTYADEVVCLESPLVFGAVAQFYREFGQVEDEAVIELLAKRETASPRG